MLKPKVRDFSKEEVKKILDFLLEQRLSNYGYLCKDFKRLTTYASKFRRYIREKKEDLINNENVRSGDYMGGRLQILVDGKVYYIVAQTWNEEYINLMRFILERGGFYNGRKWLS